jgi:hypothetical protein
MATVLTVALFHRERPHYRNYMQADMIERSIERIEGRGSDRLLLSF